jgi:hypothetical protein
MASCTNVHEKMLQLLFRMDIYLAHTFIRYQVAELSHALRVHLVLES